MDGVAGGGGGGGARGDDAEPQTREEEEADMLAALELLKQYDPAKYEALLKSMADHVNPGEEPPVQAHACALRARGAFLTGWMRKRRPCCSIPRQSALDGGGGEGDFPPLWQWVGGGLPPSLTVRLHSGGRVSHPRLSQGVLRTRCDSCFVPQPRAVCQWQHQFRVAFPRPRSRGPRFLG
jgi:hypothetical protein